MSYPNRYRAVLAAPGVSRLLIATYAGALSVGMNGLAILLFAQEATDSIAAAGLASGAYGFGRCGGTPVQGRLIDRIGARSVLVGLALAHALAMLALAISGLMIESTPLMSLAAALSGFTHPSLLSLLRALWPELIERHLLATGYAIDAVLMDVVFVSGPLVVALVAALASPVAALGLSALLVSLGTALFVRFERLPVGREARVSALGALASAGVRRLTLITVPLGLAFGAIEVGLLAFAADAGHPELAGALIGSWAAGSVAGGLLYGARTPDTELERWLPWLLALNGAAFSLMLLANTSAQMVGLAALGGVGVAPVLAVSNRLVSGLAPRGSETEAFTWPLTALIGGLGLGVAAGGALAAGSGWRLALLGASAASLAAAGLAAASGRALGPVPK